MGYRIMVLSEDMNEKRRLREYEPDRNIRFSKVINEIETEKTAYKIIKLEDSGIIVFDQEKARIYNEEMTQLSSFNVSQYSEFDK